MEVRHHCAITPPSSEKVLPHSAFNVLWLDEVGAPAHVYRTNGALRRCIVPSNLVNVQSPRYDNSKNQQHATSLRHVRPVCFAEFDESGVGAGMGRERHAMRWERGPSS